ncbi:MAG: nitroreductase family protein, partial [Paramuribaculum sp.]|nr:nitroreductase family protein [Paramuribaculum sp.]
APTTGNMQLYSAVVTRSAEMKSRLAPMHFGQPQLQGCQVAVTVCADLRRFTRWCEISGTEAGFDNLQMFFAAVLDAAMFAQQLCTAAESRGLGTCYLGTTTYNAPQIAEALSLPALVVPVTTVTIGYPDEYPADPGRLPVEAIMHCESYEDFSDSRLRQLYADKEAREDSRRFVEENSLENLAQVFAQVRYPRESNERFSESFVAYIRKAGINF